jgi:uncharacterized HAD superfamily protein
VSAPVTVTHHNVAVRQRETSGIFFMNGVPQLIEVAEYSAFRVRRMGQPFIRCSADLKVRRDGQAERACTTTEQNVQRSSPIELPQSVYGPAVGRGL